MLSSVNTQCGICTKSINNKSVEITSSPSDWLQMIFYWLSSTTHCDYENQKLSCKIRCIVARVQNNTTIERTSLTSPKRKQYVIHRQSEKISHLITGCSTRVQNSHNYVAILDHDSLTWRSLQIQRGQGKSSMAQKWTSLGTGYLVLYAKRDIL